MAITYAPKIMNEWIPSTNIYYNSIINNFTAVIKKPLKNSKKRGQKEKFHHGEIRIKYISLRPELRNLKVYVINNNITYILQLF